MKIKNLFSFSGGMNFDSNLINNIRKLPGELSSIIYTLDDTYKEIFSRCVLPGILPGKNSVTRANRFRIFEEYLYYFDSKYDNEIDKFFKLLPNYNEYDTYDYRDPTQASDFFRILYHCILKSTVITGFNKSIMLLIFTDPFEYLAITRQEICNDDWFE